MGKVAILPTSDVWTPSFTFDTPGNLAVTYSVRAGTINRLGDMALVSYSIVTSAFTFTTATGNLRIALPFTVRGAGTFTASLVYRGITKASFVDFLAQAAGGLAYMNVLCCASASAVNVIGAADMPTGGEVNLRGSILLPVA